MSLCPIAIHEEDVPPSSHVPGVVSSDSLDSDVRCDDLRFALGGRFTIRRHDVSSSFADNLPGVLPAVPDVGYPSPTIR